MAKTSRGLDHGGILKANKCFHLFLSANGCYGKILSIRETCQTLWP